MSKYVVRDEKGRQIASVEAEDWKPSKDTVYFVRGGQFVGIVWAIPGWSVIDESADQTPSRTAKVM